MIRRCIGEAAGPADQVAVRECVVFTLSREMGNPSTGCMRSITAFQRCSVDGVDLRREVQCPAE